MARHFVSIASAQHRLLAIAASELKEYLYLPRMFEVSECTQLAIPQLTNSLERWAQADRAGSYVDTGQECQE